MATKKKYYIEFGDGKSWFGTREVESDMRYSNALQDGYPIEDEQHALLSELHLHDKSLVTVRPAGDDPGFSNAPKTTLAIMCARVYALEEEDEEEWEEEEEEDLNDE